MIVCNTKPVRTDRSFDEAIDIALEYAVLEIERQHGVNSIVHVDGYHIIIFDEDIFVTMFAKLEKRGESQQHPSPCQCPLCHDPATCEICKKADVTP